MKIWERIEQMSEEDFYENWRESVGAMSGWSGAMAFVRWRTNDVRQWLIKFFKHLDW